MKKKKTREGRVSGAWENFKGTGKSTIVKAARPAAPRRRKLDERGRMNRMRACGWQLALLRRAFAPRHRVSRVRRETSGSKKTPRDDGVAGWMSG